MSQQGSHNYSDGPPSASSSAMSATSSLPPRRSRAVACAECRRLKLKCDREFPCMNCRRREVASLCPTGALVTRSRLSSAAIAEASQVKHDVAWMSERIKQLEEALALVQSKITDEPHPLLLATPSPPRSPGEGNNKPLGRGDTPPENEEKPQGSSTRP